MSDYSLLLEFDRDTIDFADGFELGRVWESLDNGPSDQEAVVHTRNAEMIVRIAEARGFDVRWEEEEDDMWARAFFTHVGEASR